MSYDVLVYLLVDRQRGHPLCREKYLVKELGNMQGWLTALKDLAIFAPMAKFYKSLANFCGLIRFWPNFEGQ